MDRDAPRARHTLTRRRLLSSAAALGAGLAARPLLADPAYDLHLPGRLSTRPLTDAFPGKHAMIAQRMRPPLLETPFEVFEQGVITPNDRFFVRWHWDSVPTEVDAAAFRLAVHGNVVQPLSLSLPELLHDFPVIETTAVNQCSGNSRGLFEPGVPGAQWGHGAMGNAVWTGVPLRAVLERAGVKPGSGDVRFAGLDDALLSDAPKFMKSLALDHANDGEVMLAYAMNGEQLPALNGFPLRLIVPGWFSTYWVKALADIEVLAGKDDNYWMAKAYLVPDRPFGDVPPGLDDFAKVPISRMPPRSFITSPRAGSTQRGGRELAVAGLALGGDCGVARIELSADGGRTWSDATLEEDHGQYSFRRFHGLVHLPATGPAVLASRCTNTRGVSQPLAMNWNPGGFMRSGIETVTVEIGR